MNSLGGLWEKSSGKRGILPVREPLLVFGAHNLVWYNEIPRGAPKWLISTGFST
jgi:hypothetical protein